MCFFVDLSFCFVLTLQVLMDYGAFAMQNPFFVGIYGLFGKVHKNQIDMRWVLRGIFGAF